MVKICHFYHRRVLTFIIVRAPSIPAATNNTAAPLTFTTPFPFDWIDTAGNDVVTDER